MLTVREERCVSKKTDICSVWEVQKTHERNKVRLKKLWLVGQDLQDGIAQLKQRAAGLDGDLSNCR